MRCTTKASSGQRRPEGLERIADQAGDFALAEVELAVVLVKDHDSTERITAIRREQEGGNAVAFEPWVLEPLALEPV